MNKITKLNTIIALLITMIACMTFTSCEAESDQVQTQQQEQILAEGTAAVGMPNIRNFRERRLAKDILEMRDQDGLVTYTYIVAEQTGKLIFLGESVGYGLPYSTQFTNPMKLQRFSISGGSLWEVVPQAEPNGLFSPESSDGTWVLLKDPNGDSTKPVLVEPRCIVSPFRLNTN